MSEILFEAIPAADLTVFAQKIAARETDPLTAVLPNHPITGFRTRSTKVSRTTTAAISVTRCPALGLPPVVSTSKTAYDSRLRSTAVSRATANRPPRSRPHVVSADRTRHAA